MQVKTVLNRVHKIKGFVYEQVRFVGDVIEVDVRPRRGSRPYCSGCGRRGSTYDHQATRRFAFVPLWAIGVYLLYAMRRGGNNVVDELMTDEVVYPREEYLRTRLY